MSTNAAAKETFFAPPEATSEAGELYNFIAAHEQKNGTKPKPQFFLSGAAEGDQVELPYEIYEVLVKAVDAMRKGQAVTLTPRSMTLTTQQAAELLGVTRPTIVRLLDDGKIPYEKPQTHRRVKLVDVLEFKARRKVEQYAALDSLGDTEDESPAVVIEQLKEAKAEAARRRRASK